MDSCAVLPVANANLVSTEWGENPKFSRCFERMGSINVFLKSYDN